jgi:hypothetical protein
MNQPDKPSLLPDFGIIEKSKPESLSPEPDDRTEEEQSDYEQRRKNAIIRSLEQDIDERKKYANRNFWLTVVWLALINLILILQGFRVAIVGHSFELPTSVLLTAIGSTTASVVGIFLIVTNYLFPKR